MKRLVEDEYDNEYDNDVEDAYGDEHDPQSKLYPRATVLAR